jgi:4-cresol dehydrogenase (hydroxylating)
MGDLTRTLEAWQHILGKEHVITDEAERLAAETTTYATTQHIPAIIRPANRSEVQECVRIANQYKTPIYPISTGKNWGLGSRVPVQDGCIIMDLGRLNRIVDYNEELAYITVEPGVTQQQAYEFLLEQKSSLWLNTTGSSPHSSLIGNTVDRGAAKNPYRDRFAHVCGFEVVLPTGECIHTGFGRFANAKAAKVNRWGVGPALDGIFTQSNLGIVTQMTMWLIPEPAFFQIFELTLNDDTRLEKLVDALRQLKLTGLRTSFVIGNDMRRISSRRQYPWAEMQGQTPLSSEMQQTLRAQHKIALWSGRGALYSASLEHGLAERQLLENTLGTIVDTLHFFDPMMDKIPSDELASQYPNLNIKRLQSAFRKGSLQGVPTRGGLPIPYWRKHTRSATMDIDADDCGFLWCLPAVPTKGQHVREAVTIIEETLRKYQFESNMALNIIDERNIYITCAIIYDRTIEKEDERAMACSDEMHQRLATAGYLPYRLGIHNMNALPPAQDDYGFLLSQLKQALDPNNILAPGRYDFRAEWPTD